MPQMDARAGLPRLTFWSSHVLGHLLLYAVGFVISSLIQRFLGAHWGMRGMADNNFLGYFLVHVLFAPTCILLGYNVSFFFEKDETAQIATDQIANLPLVTRRSFNMDQCANHSHLQV